MYTLIYLLLLLFDIILKIFRRKNQKNIMILDQKNWIKLLTTVNRNQRCVLFKCVHYELNYFHNRLLITKKCEKLSLVI